MQNKFETILSIYKFCARTDARTYAHARVFWPEIDRTDIDLDHDKYELKNHFWLWRYDQEFIFRKFHKMAPRWRHESRSRSKNLLCFVHMPIHMCVKFQGIWLNHFHVILSTKKWVEIRKIKNNNNKGNFYKIIRWSVLDTAHLIIKAILTKLWGGLY